VSREYARCNVKEVKVCRRVKKKERKERGRSFNVPRAGWGLSLHIAKHKKRTEGKRRGKELESNVIPLIGKKMGTFAERLQH